MWIFWLFNSDKNIIIELDKLNYKEWEIISGKIKFDFWDEKVKANNISIWLVRETKSTSMSEDWVNTSTTKTFLSEDILASKWEYSSWEYEFKLAVPVWANWAKVNIDWIADNISNWTMKNIVNVVADTFWDFVWNKYLFYVVARIDIPWAIDITTKKNINIIED